ncbi:MAG: hypothetical protein DMF81_09405, partial [Acidobacteria bacterium]
MADDRRVVIVGGGPAGLTAAYALMKAGLPSVVLEKEAQVGGHARTVCHDGFLFDVGGHRFFTKIPEVRQIWQEVLGERFLRVPAPLAHPVPGPLLPLPAEAAGGALAHGPVRERLGGSQLHAQEALPHAGGRHPRELDVEPLRPPPLPHVLQDVHREGVGPEVHRDPIRLGRAADQRPDPRRGDAQRA